MKKNPNIISKTNPLFPELKKSIMTTPCYGGKLEDGTYIHSYFIQLHPATEYEFENRYYYAFMIDRYRSLYFKPSHFIKITKQLYLDGIASYQTDKPLLI